jgi:hypothetical protein
MDAMTKTIRLIVATCALVLITACEEIDTSALQELEEGAASARAAADEVNARSEQLRRASEDPLGTLQEVALGATFSKTETAEPGVFVLTDLQTGCQWLATYGADGEATSMEPRNEAAPGGGTQQRCVSVPGVSN